MWISISPVDIEQAKRHLAVRHAELLARHANEIQSLEADEAQIGELAGRVETFMRKFKPPAPEPKILLSRRRQPEGEAKPAALKVAGFDRAMLPIDPRVTPSGTVAIDFRYSSRKSIAGA